MPDFTAFPAEAVLRNMKLVPAVMKSAKIVWSYVVNVAGVRPVSTGKMSTVQTAVPAAMLTPGYAENVTPHARNVTVLTALTVICAANVSVRNIVQSAVSVKMIRSFALSAVTVSSAAGHVQKVPAAEHVCSVIGNMVQPAKTAESALLPVMEPLIVRNVTPVRNV